MTAFVLGATGFVGREVTRQLCVRAVETYAHVRPDSSSLEAWRGKLTEVGARVDVTPWQADALAERWRALDIAQVYILIGTTRGRARADGVEGDIYERIDYGLTAIAVDAATRSGQKPRLIYLSSLGADASARGAYLKARGRAEDAVRSSGCAYAIARPAIITGERDEARTGERAAAVVGDGLLAVAGLFSRALKEKYASTTPDVLAAALIRLGEASGDMIASGGDLR